MNPGAEEQRITVWSLRADVVSPKITIYIISLSIKY